MAYYKYGKKEMDYLSGKDKNMALLITRHGKLKRTVNPNIFEALIHSIISQQISNKAASTVSQRLIDLVGVLTPKAIYACAPSAIQQCGMTHKKAYYIKGAAEAVIKGHLDLNSFNTMCDTDVIKVLSQLPGIGVWTAEMLLFHSLERPDIFSFNDLVIRNNLAKIQGHSELSKKKFDLYRKRYSPYCSTAMIYLWAMNDSPDI